MHVSNYTPFECSFNDLKPEDLAALREVEEGWYVDYKREAISAKNIAKGLAAFANTYGGWLFFGVDEAEDQSNPVAASFPGLDTDQAQQLSQTCRQGAAAYLSESPYFDLKILSGPCEALGLPSDRAIVVLNIPQSMQAPHIHKDGGIYRRVSSGSEPTKENDRHIIDSLFKRRVQAERRIERWINSGLELSEEEQCNPYIRILIDLDPELKLNNNRKINKSNIITKLIDVTNHKSIPSIQLDAISITPKGATGRHVVNNSIEAETVSMTVNMDLSCEIVIPINIMSDVNIDAEHLYIENYNYYSQYIEILKSVDKYASPPVADLNYTYIAIMSLFDKYLSLLEEVNFDGNLFSKVEGINVWRVCPFLDVEYFLNIVKSLGVPMSRKRSVFNPPGVDPASFFPHPKLSEINAQNDKNIGENEQRFITVSLHSQILFHLICNIFGMPGHLEDKNLVKDNCGTSLFEQLNTITKTAMKVSSLKSQLY